MKKFEYTSGRYGGTFQIECAYCTISESGALAFYDEQNGLLHAVERRNWETVSELEAKPKLKFTPIKRREVIEDETVPNRRALLREEADAARAQVRKEANEIESRLGLSDDDE